MHTSEENEEAERTLCPLLLLALSVLWATRGRWREVMVEERNEKAAVRKCRLKAVRGEACTSDQHQTAASKRASSEYSQSGSESS